MENLNKKELIDLNQKIDIKQRLIDRIEELKTNKRNLFGDENYRYIGGGSILEKDGLMIPHLNFIFMYTID